jgi:hypothetical protein
MKALEVIALIVAIGIIVKLIALLCCKKKWVKFVKKFYKNTGLAVLIFLILGVVVFGYLIQELTIIQIFAAMAFCGILAGLSLCAYPGEIIGFAERVLKGKLPGLVWISGLIWLVLSIWVLVKIFY